VPVRRIAVCLSVSLALAVASAAAAPTVDRGAPVGTFHGCPRDPRPLPPRLAGYEPAVRAAVLHFVHTGFLRFARTPASQLVGARVMKVVLVPHWFPSGWIKLECGATVWRRSVAVAVYFPRLDKPHNPIGHCNACAVLTFIAARTLSGWTVWARY
jgi:hypothetical protein